MDTEYSAFDLARYVLKKCIDENHPVCNLQLQKILYYIQECFLKEKDRKAFPEPIEAWQFGRVNITVKPANKENMNSKKLSWKEQFLAGAEERAKILQDAFTALAHGKITAEEMDEAVALADSKVINKE